MPPRRTNINDQDDEARPIHGIQTRNRAHTPELIPTPGVPPVPTSPPRAPQMGANRTQPHEREISNIEFR